MYEIHHPMFCPVCGIKVEIGDEQKFCSHILFIYVWGDPDFFAYVSYGFASKYMEILESSNLFQEYIAEHELEIDERLEGLFTSAGFHAMDEVSTSIPFDENVAKAACPEHSIIFAVDYGHYSGAYVGIGCKD